MVHIWLISPASFEVLSRRLHLVQSSSIAESGQKCNKKEIDNVCLGGGGERGFMFFHIYIVDLGASLLLNISYESRIMTRMPSVSNCFPSQERPLAVVLVLNQQHKTFSAFHCGSFHSQHYGPLACMQCRTWGEPQRPGGNPSQAQTWLVLWPCCLSSLPFSVFLCEEN